MPSLTISQGFRRSGCFRTMIRLAIPGLTVAAFVAAGPPNARDGLIARIGDIDGFGYGAAAGVKAANRNAANAHGHTVLGNGDFLPDVNHDGTVAVQGGDEFDLRGDAERANTANTFGAGVVKGSGTSGSKFTDISLSRNYGQASAAGRVLGHNIVSKRFGFGRGGRFPHSPSNVLPIQPGFVFKLEISKEDLAGQTPIFFNIVFGDYDVFPAKVRITRSDGTVKDLDVNVQSGREDGLIQAATTTLEFSDVFRDGGKMWTGFIKVDFLAPNEPYTAFDYVELSTTALVVAPQQIEVEQGDQFIEKRRP
jgi:hypothetical protein